MVSENPGRESVLAGLDLDVDLSSVGTTNILEKAITEAMGKIRTGVMSKTDMDMFVLLISHDRVLPFARLHIPELRGNEEYTLEGMKVFAEAVRPLLIRQNIKPNAEIGDASEYFPPTMIRDLLLLEDTNEVLEDQRLASAMRNIRRLGCKYSLPNNDYLRSQCLMTCSEGLTSLSRSF